MATLKEYLPYYKRNLKVALPVMLTQIGASLVGIADSIMVGHYSTADLAAVSFSNALFFTVMVFGMGSMMGITPLVGMAFVQGRHNDVAGYLHGGFRFAIIMMLLTGLPLAIAIPFLDHFGQESVVVTAARPYYIMVVISIIPSMLFFLLKQFFEGLGNTMVAMLITLATNILNIFLNWVFIFGHFGFSAMGAGGAGIATLIARALTPLCFIVVMICKSEWRKYLFNTAQHAYKAIVRELGKVGLPIGGQTLLETIAFTLSFIMVGWINKESLAAHQIANQIADLTFMLAIGIGSATTIRVSHQLGEGNLEGVRMASNASIHLVLLMNAIGATLMISLRGLIPYAFTNDEEVVRIASILILCAGMFQFADGMQTVGAAMLRGITDVRMPMLYALIAYILVALPVGALCMFTLHMGAPGMWVGFILGLSVAAALFHTRFRKRLRIMLDAQ